MLSQTNKEDLAQKITTQLQEWKAIDLRVFLDGEGLFFEAYPSLVSEIANIIRREKKYRLRPEGIGDRFTYILTKESLRELNPLAAELRAGFITGIISLVVGIGLYLIDNQAKDRMYKLQDERLNRLSDSIKNLEVALHDSIAGLKRP